MPSIEHHTQCHEQIPKHFCIRCEHISGEDVAEFAFRRFCDTAYRYATEDGEESGAAIASYRRRDDEGGDEVEEVEVWEDLPREDGSWGAAGDCPKEEEGGEKWK